MWIAAQAYRAEVRPEQGGMVAALQFKAKSGWCDILRPEPATGATQDGLPLFGSFAMVPFANRLPSARLPFGRGEVHFARNWPSEGIAHHGTVWGQVWQIDASDGGACVLSTLVRDVAGQVLGRAEQAVDLTAKGLQIRLSYHHFADQPMPVGLGQHPWFYTPEPDACAAFAVQGEFLMGPNHLPDGHLAQPVLRELTQSDNGFNGCFSGWSGTARLLRPKAGLEVRCRADSDLLHCYVAGGLAAMCLEPVTHRPGGADDPRWPELGAMHLLQPGQSVAMTMQISAHDILGRSNDPTWTK